MVQTAPRDRLVWAQFGLGSGRCLDFSEGPPFEVGKDRALRAVSVLVHDLDFVDEDHKVAFLLLVDLAVPMRRRGCASTARAEVDVADPRLFPKLSERP